MKVHLNLSNGRMFTNHVSSSLESSVVGTWKQFWHQARWARPNHPKQWITTQNTRLQIHVDNSNTNTFSAMKHIFFVFARTIPKWTPDRFCKENESEIDGPVVICGKRGEKIFHYDKELRKWKWTLKGSSKVKEAKSWKRPGENTDCSPWLLSDLSCKEEFRVEWRRTHLSELRYWNAIVESSISFLVVQPLHYFVS